MEPISTILLAAAGYILKGAAESKVAASAKEQLLGKFWNWIKPKFIKDVPEIEEKPDDPEVQAKTQTVLLEMVKDESFFNELEQKVAELRKAGVKEKNIFKGDIEGAEEVVIGDKTYSPNESWDRKNIVEGNVRGTKDAPIKKFTLGDGH